MVVNNVEVIIGIVATEVVDIVELMNPVDCVGFIILEFFTHLFSIKSKIIPRGHIISWASHCPELRITLTWSKFIKPYNFIYYPKYSQ